MEVEKVERKNDDDDDDDDGDDDDGDDDDVRRWTVMDEDDVCMYESQPFERCCMFCRYTRFGNHFGFTYGTCSCGIHGKGRRGYAKMGDK